MRLLPFCFLIAVGFSGCSDSYSSTNKANPNQQHSVTALNPDNTGINQRDRNSAAQTPLDQNENQKDIDMTANIRSRVVDTKMSVDAQNVKIITQNGSVTLRGPVKSLEEKKQIEDIAHAVAGSDKVDNQLDVEQQH